MNVLSVAHLTKSYGTETVLSDISLLLESGERVGLIGRNGAGKSTLFKILTGQLESDAGQIWLMPGKTVGYLRQESGETDPRSLKEFCTDVFVDLIAAENAIKAQEDAIHTMDHESEAFTMLLDAYHHAVEDFEAQGGYTFRSRVSAVLKGLGFSDEDQERPSQTLSGGQLTRLSIARLLLSEPDILLLDEPTNHLDIAAVQWLESYLKQFRGTLLLITHDRFFLDQVTTRIIEIEHGKAASHKGNYSAFQTNKKRVLESQLKAYEKQESELAKQEELIRRFKQHGTEKLAKRAKSREKLLEHMVRTEAPEQEESRFRLQFEVASPSGHDVLAVRDISVGFGENRLFSNVSFDIYKGERIGLIGPNGIGKTTLFRMILGELPPWNGTIIQGHNVLPGNYDQNLQFVNDRQNLLEELADCRPDLTDTRLRSLLGAFLFTGADAFKPLSILSGGEKARLSLLKLLLGTSNLLLMDEPTNHLDIPAREVLEEALTSYEGTLFVISHDRYFLDKVCTKILELKPEGATEFFGNYSYYVSKCSEGEKTVPEADAEAITRTRQKELKRREKDLEKELRNAKREVQSLEQQIEELEAEIERLMHALCLEEVYANPQRSIEVQQALDKARSELDDTYQRWTELLESKQ